MPQEPMERSALRWREGLAEGIYLGGRQTNRPENALIKCSEVKRQFKSSICRSVPTVSASSIIKQWQQDSCKQVDGKTAQKECEMLAQYWYPVSVRYTSGGTIMSKGVVEMRIRGAGMGAQWAQSLVSLELRVCVPGRWKSSGGSR